MHPLQSVSPIDGRYQSTTAALSGYFSEFGLIKHRVIVEVAYFVALCSWPIDQLKAVDPSALEKLQQSAKDFSEADAMRIKEIEAEVNHDVKAVEYFLREQFEKLGLSDYKEFIHFGLTSQDINNTANPLMFKAATKEVTIPVLGEILTQLDAFATEWKDIPMLARTHGQPASPTKLGKEIRVFHERLQRQINQLENQSYFAKFGGATGNFNAHQVAYPQIDWVQFANDFVGQSLGLERQQTTTQIEHYDGLSEWLDNQKRINTVLIDLCRDIWSYVSMNYFKQKLKKKEVGSSAMPHKVNPIDFENAEGNLGLANALLDHLSSKLPVSRLQRDLTDSTVLRNVGVPVAHSYIAYRSILKGLGKLLLDEQALQQDLQDHYLVVAEGIQTILRREGYPHPYEALKQLTRTNEQISAQHINQFIDGLDIAESVKEELKQITPSNYTGVA